MRRVFRTLLATGSVIALLISNSGLAFAAVQGADCVGDTSKVRLYENAQGDNSDGNDQLWRCASTTDLSSIAHEPAGTCKSGLFSGNTWNDCVSSYRFWVPAGQRLILYRNDDYEQWSECVPGPQNGVNPVASGSNDTLTSFRWRPGAQCLQDEG